MSYIKERLLSFKHAINGVVILFRKTPNAKIQLALAVAVILLGILLGISKMEWIAVIIVIGFVLAMEAFNTSLERLSDYTCNKKYHPLIKTVKDLAAAAVLIAAITALIIGIIIFLPKIINLL